MHSPAIAGGYSCGAGWSLWGGIRNLEQPRKRGRRMPCAILVSIESDLIRSRVGDLVLA